MKQLSVIYIPGIGDTNPATQRKAVKTWAWWGVEAELFQMNWQDDTKWAVKFQRLLDRIDEISSKGQPVALVGASAGASACINAYAARKKEIVGIVSISGKINNPQDIGPRYRTNNPSFVESAYACEQSLNKLNESDRSHILSRYAIFDAIVLRRDSKVLGAHNRTVPSLGHLITIALQITIGAPSFIRFLKKQIK